MRQSFTVCCHRCRELGRGISRLCLGSLERGWKPQLGEVRIAKVGSATVSKKEHKGCLFSRQTHALGYRPGDDCQALGRVLREQGWMRLCGSGNTQIGTSQGAGNRRRGGEVRRAGLRAVDWMCSGGQYVPSRWGPQKYRRPRRSSLAALAATAQSHQPTASPHATPHTIATSIPAQPCQLCSPQSANPRLNRATTRQVTLGCDGYTRKRCAIFSARCG